jgi:catechol 2,3-dioxygenase-like lactoylglutathione lyase family enzyme
MKARLGWPSWVGVVADDLEAQRRFYCDVLGLREIEAGPDWVQGDLDGHPFEVIRRGRCSRPPHRASALCGLVRRWARVPSCRQLSDLGGS